ncbi:MAG: AAA family ATPase [Acidimicrobiia bacterium]|nr:AAA family ATPase [Acidimicrobiia bacterium]
MGDIDQRDLLPAPIQRVRLRNFRSIERCDVALSNLNVLVGPNASGKSNLLDALQFTRDALHFRLDEALRMRDGFSEVCRKSEGSPIEFAVRIDLAIRRRSDTYSPTAFYAFKVGAAPGGGYLVQREMVEHRTPLHLTGFERIGDDVRLLKYDGEDSMKAPASDDLFLSQSGLFPEVFDQLRHMTVYALDPVTMRKPQRSAPHEVLVRDGRNLGGVLRNHPSTRVCEYLSTIVPGVENVEGVHIGGYDTFHVIQRVDGSSSRSTTFSAASVSDGTLRALGVLVALLADSPQPGRPPRPPLSAIEEIEAGLHPGAVGILWDAMCEASLNSQIVVSTHSPDLLDRDDLQDDATLLGVAFQAGRTIVGTPSKADMRILEERLCTPGDLLRQVRLQPAPMTMEPPDQDMFALSVSRIGP